jgi:DNA primase
MSKALSSHIPEATIRHIREAGSIVEVVSDYVRLKKAGSSYRGLCPFHNEKTPSFFVSEGKKCFNCFGCGERGDVFAFLMKHENMGFQEAVRTVARRYGITVPEKPLSPDQQYKKSEKEQFFLINEAVAELYNRCLLNDPAAEKARRYLAERGISRQTIKDYCLGFAPQRWDTVVGYLRSKNLDWSRARKIGLIIQKDKSRFYDRFRNRIMFPIFNVSRHVLGFGGRIIDSGEPKYLNSPESELYSKRHSLYGLHAAAREISKNDGAIIVEGYFDVLRLHQAGIVCAVASLGTALTEYQIQMLRRYTSRMVTVFDADASGEKAMMRSLEPFLKNNLFPRLVILPEGSDPDSFVKDHGPEAFSKRVEDAQQLLDYVIEKIIAKHTITHPQGKVAACDEIMPVLSMITDALTRDLYVQNVAQRIGVPERRLRERMRPHGTGPAVRQQQDIEQPRRGPAEFDRAEVLIIQLMTRHPPVNEIIMHEGIIEELSETTLRDIGRSILDRYRQDKSVVVADVLESLDSEQTKQYIAEIAFQEEGTADPVKVLGDCIRKVRLKNIKRERKKVNMLLKQAEANKDDTASTYYQQQYMELVKEQEKVMHAKVQLSAHGAGS